MKRTYLLVFVLGLLCVYNNAEAKTLYVSPGGNDSTTYSNNSESTPWATIGRAAWGSTNRASTNSTEAAQQGDTVIVSAGTYNQSATGGSRSNPLYNPVNNGSAGSPITFRANGLVTLQSTTYNGPVIGSTNKSYIVWDGFYIDEADILTGPDTGPVVVWNSNNVTLQNLEIKSKYATWSDNHNGVRIERSNFITVKNNLIWNVGSVNGQGTQQRGQNDAGVMLYDTNDSIIENNEIHTMGTGVYVKGDSPGYTQLRNTIRYNLIHGAQASAITLNTSTDTKVYQNVIKDSNIGVTITDLGAVNGTPVNDIVANNTFHNISLSGVYFRGSFDNWVNIRFWNNIFSDLSLQVVYGYDNNFAGPEDSDFQHNLYSDHGVNFARFTGGYSTFDLWKTTFGQDGVSPLSLSSNPLFINESSDDFHLQSSSPARSLGVDILDLNSNGSFSDEIHAGAYISGSEIIGRNIVTPTPPPPSPTPTPTPSPSPVPVVGDINLDHVVNSVDWSLMNTVWFTNNTASDLNNDGSVNSLDFALLSSNWLRTW